MAVYGFHWSIPNLFGVLAAGIVYDYIGENWVWYIAGILCLIAIVGFWMLHKVAKDRLAKETETLVKDVSIKLREELNE